jgi:hypothetical protein
LALSVGLLGLGEQAAMPNKQKSTKLVIIKFFMFLVQLMGTTHAVM